VLLKELNKDYYIIIVTILNAIKLFRSQNDYIGRLPPFLRIIDDGKVRHTDPNGGGTPKYRFPIHRFQKYQ
jgi:hypothetical protein